MIPSLPNWSKCFTGNSQGFVWVCFDDLLGSGFKSWIFQCLSIYPSKYCFYVLYMYAYDIHVCKHMLTCFNCSYICIYMPFLFCFLFFLTAIWLFHAMTNFGPLSRGQPHSPGINRCVLHFWPKGHQKPCNEVGSLSLAKPSRVWTRRFLILTTTP